MVCLSDLYLLLFKAYISQVFTYDQILLIGADLKNFHFDRVMLTTEITYALADWIIEWRKFRNEDPTLDECLKFVEWKASNYNLTESDRMIVESILIYETEKI